MSYSQSAPENLKYPKQTPAGELPDVPKANSKPGTTHVEPIEATNTASKTNAQATNANNKNAGAETSNTATVYRTQGGEMPNASQERIKIGQNGSVSIVGNNMLYVTIDDKAHQLYFYNKRGGSEKGASVVSIQIPQSFADEIKKMAVPQAQGKMYPNRPQISDPSRSNSAYGLPKEYIDKLRQLIIQGSGKVETGAAVKKN